MEVIYLISFFLLGMILGSFYHVVGTRLAVGESIIYPNSHCDNCKHPLKVKDLIPVLSFLLGKGKCRYCKTKLSILYPFLELTTGLLFMISFYSFGFTIDLLIAIGVSSLFVIILASDLTYMIIPDEVLLFFSIYFIVLQVISGGFINALTHIGTGLFLFLVMYFFMWLGKKIFKKESLGGGDVKLMFLIGLVLVPITGIFSIFLASLIALPVSLFLYFFKKEKVIPFGPFLVLAELILLFMKIDMNFIETILNL